MCRMSRYHQRNVNGRLMGRRAGWVRLSLAWCTEAPQREDEEKAAPPSYAFTRRRRQQHSKFSARKRQISCASYAQHLMIRTERFISD
jgi:6-phosphofructokinase